MIRYEWRGIPVTEEQFLNLTASEMVQAEQVHVSAGKSTVINRCSVPLCFLETQRFGPGVTGTADYTYWRKKES